MGRGASALQYLRSRFGEHDVKAAQENSGLRSLGEIITPILHSLQSIKRALDAE